MISGIRLVDKIYKKAYKAGFYAAELRYEDLGRFNEEESCLPIKCITLSGFLMDRIDDAVKKAGELGAPYLLIETKGLHGIENIKKVLKSKAYLIDNSNITVVIENGYFRDGNRIRRNGLNDIGEFRSLLKELRESVSEPSKYGAALNGGYSMLFRDNIPGFAYELGSDLMFLHVNENDGIHDMQQLPFTFTVGRGTLLNDWGKLIRELHTIGFDGGIFMDMDGLFSALPDKLVPSMLKMAQGILAQWDNSFRWAEIIPENKKLITFGSGRMLSFYMDNFGDKRKPYFTADNNSELWGKSAYGVDIRPPDDILKIPEDERFVLICNMHFVDIGAQLGSMGVRVDGIFDDNYFLYEDRQYAKNWCPDKGDIGKGTIKKWYRYDTKGRLRKRRLQPRRIYTKLRDIWRKAKSLLRRALGKV